MTFALDGYGPACNVTADGALALAIDRFFGRKTAAAHSASSEPA